MKRNLLFILILLNTLCIFGQEYKVFKNHDNQKFGLKNTVSDEIIIKAQYNNLWFLNDTLLVAKKDGANSKIIDCFGNQYCEYDQTLFEIPSWNCDYQVFDPRYPLKLCSFPYYDKEGKSNIGYYFYVNVNNECLPSSYMPCPYWAKKNLTLATDYEKIIQEGEKQLYAQNIDSAVYYCKKALEINPNEPSIYFWGANIFIQHYAHILGKPNYNKIIVNYTNNSEYSHYFDWVQYCLNKAEELETNTYFSIQIQKAKRKFYKYSLKDKIRTKEAKEKIKALKQQCKTTAKQP